MRAAALTALLLCLTALGLVWLLARQGIGGPPAGLFEALRQPVGLGLVAGVLLGAACSGFGIAIQAQLAETRPALLIPGLAIGFGLKFVVLLCFAALFLIWPDLVESLHPIAALGAYAIAAFLVLLAGTFSTARSLKRRSPPAPAAAA
jgi:hypothetical protein